MENYKHLNIQGGVPPLDYFRSQIFKIPPGVKLEILTVLNEGPKAWSTPTKRLLPSTNEAPGTNFGGGEPQKGIKSEAGNPLAGPSFALSGFFLKCIGPLGSILINLQKFDSFGLCFFEIKEILSGEKKNGKDFICLHKNIFQKQQTGGL